MSIFNAGANGLDDTDLHAFIDGELPPARMAEIAALITADPTLAARVDAFRADKLMLAALFAPVAHAPVPAAWIATIETATSPRAISPWRRISPQVLALAAMLVIALLSGMYIGGHIGGDPALDAAFAARDTSSAALESFAGNDLAMKAAAHKAGLAATPHAPNLARFGYRLASVDRYPHALSLRYVRAEGAPLTIYLRASPGEARFDILLRDGLRVCIWQDDVVSAVMVGKMSAGEMMRLASAAYSSLNL